MLHDDGRKAQFFGGSVYDDGMRLQVIAFALGILILQIQPIVPAHAAWLCGLVILLPLLCGRRGMVPIALVLSCLIGFGWAAWRAEIRLADALVTEWEGRDVDIVGVVASLPQDSARGVRFEMVLEQTLTAQAVLPSRLMLSWYQGRQEDGAAVWQEVRPGERWRLTVRLKRPHGNANPQAFDYEAWLLERNIRAIGYVRQAPAQRLAAMVWQPEYVIERWRDRIRDRFEAMLPAAENRYAGVLLALAIGDQKAINGDLWPLFNRTGITHLVSISGLHVTMLAALVGGLAGWVWRRLPFLAQRCPAQKLALLAGCLTALLYALLAGFAVPAQRTAYMLCVAALSLLSGRLLAPSRTLCLALLLVLVLDPWAVLAAGFWLSFGAVAVLLYVGSGQAGPVSGWRARLAAWGWVQWAATLASLPILLLLFQQFSLVSPLANALAIPVISFIVTPLALLAALLPWWPLLWVAHGVMDSLMLFIGWCAGWPVWQVPAPPAWAALLAACGVVICLLPRGVPGRMLGIFLLLPALFWQPDRVPEGEARVTVLDVGQGLASVIQTRNHLLIYDPGPLYSAESDAGQRVVVPFLRTLGVNQVDAMIVTHRDSDHSGGAASLLSSLPVGQILSSMKDIGAEPCVAGQSWWWDGVEFAILHPDAKATHAGKSNHLSCVLSIDAGGKRMLLTSDIEAPDEAALLRRYPSGLQADVLLVPHHGSKTSSSPAFLAAVGASEAVIPVGYRNAFGHPKPEVVARYQDMGTRLWRTDRDGAIRIALGSDKVRISAWRQENIRYWHGR